MRAIPLLVVAVTLASVVGACSSNTVIVHQCSEGKSTSCTGAGGCSGQQTCASGQYGACQCGDLDASAPSDAPADTVTADAALHGIGDLCSNNSDCISDYCASTSHVAWCTKVCDISTNCVGIYIGAKNQFGQGNYCVSAGSSGQNFCVPGCKSNADCMVYPGTTCVATTETQGAPVHVCST